MKNLFSAYKYLSNVVYKIAIVRFILAMGNFIFPFMTLLLVKKLSISPQIASIYYIVLGLMFVPSALISGRISDKIGRRFILLFSFLIYILIILFVFIVFHFEILKGKIIAILLIVSNLFLSMTTVPISTIITDVTNPNDRTEAFSLTYLANNLGFAFGPLIAGFLFEKYTSLIFLGNSLFSLFGFIILLTIKETKPKEIVKYNNDAGENSEQKDRLNSVLHFILHDKLFIVFIIANIFFAFAYSQAGFTLPIFLTKIFNDKGPKYYGILQSTNAITVILLTSIISIMTKKKSPFLMVGIAGLFYAVGFGLYSIFKIFPLLIVITILWSIGEIIQVTHQNVFVANRSPINIRGQVNSAFQILSGSGFVLGPLFSGFYQKNFTILSIWIIVFLISLIGSLLLFLNHRKNVIK